jgi:hypothetical protein
MEHLRMRAWGAGLAVVAMLSASVAVAQPDLPRENHYQVYHTPPITYTKPILLTDQFATYQTSTFILERWANPAEKILPDTGEHFPPVDPFIHQTWWRATLPAAPPRDIVVIDQFGTSQWKVYDPVYLLNPALKNVPGGQPPFWNHYLCYDAIGPIVVRPVVLVDQFGTTTVVGLQSRWFCNPVEKRHLDDGLVYPILDYKAHLACYIKNPNPMAQPIIGVDQFGQWQFDVFQSDCLCVPALKEHVVKTEESTWGKIKAMYN